MIPRFKKVQKIIFSEIFQKKGEKYFRGVETRELKKLHVDTYIPGIVMAIGGGLPCNSRNLSFMKEHGIIVYLKVSIDDIIQRIGKNSSRPIFQNLRQKGNLNQNIENLLKQREKYYNQADITLSSSNIIKPENIASFLGKKLHGNYQDEIGNNFNTRIEGTRIKHSMGKVSIKMYDKFSLVLRIETTVNDVSFLKHYRWVVP